MLASDDDTDLIVVVAECEEIKGITEMPVESQSTGSAKGESEASGISNNMPTSLSESPDAVTPDYGLGESTDATQASDSSDSESKVHQLTDHSLLLDDSRLTADSEDVSILACNTLDDVSSLQTQPGDSPSSIRHELDVLSTESDIGEISTNLSPSSLKEPAENNGDVDTDEGEDTEDGWLDVIGSGDLMKQIIRKGKGVNSRPQRGSVVIVNVSGQLEDGLVIEDSQKKRIFVGDCEVIQGLDLTIPLMELTEISVIVVKPRLAYGRLGREPDVPPNATIKYQVELLSIEDEPDPDTMTFAERIELGNYKREIGNFWYTRGEHSSALQCYRRSLDFIDDSKTNFTTLSDEQKELVEMWMKVSNNMAAAQLKIGAYDAALKSVENVLKLQPQNVKALFRKGKILSSMGNTTDAVSCMKKALKLEPETKIIHQELSSLIAKQKSEVKSEREMYKRMLGQDKQQQPKPIGKSSGSAFLKWGVVAGSVVAAVLSVVAYRHFHVGSTI